MQTENIHRTRAGAYLSACCIYAAVFKESPVGATYHGTLTKKVAKQLQ